LVLGALRTGHRVGGSLLDVVTQILVMVIAIPVLILGLGTGQTV